MSGPSRWLGTRRWRHPDDYPYAVACSADGQLVATAGERHIIVFDARTGREQARFAGHGHAKIQPARGALAFARDGELVSGGLDGRLRVFDPAKGSIVREIDFGEGDRPYKVAKGRSEVANLFANARAGIEHVAFFEGGRVVVAGGTRVACFDLATGERRWIAVEENWINALAASARSIALAVRDTIIFRDALGGEKTHTLPGHKGGMLALAISPRSRLASAGRDGVVRLRDLSSDGEGATIHSDPKNLCEALAFAGDERLALGGAWSSDRWVALHVPGRPGFAWSRRPAAKGSVSSVAFAPDGERVYAAALGGLRVYASAGGRNLKARRGHEGWVQEVHFLDDGRLVTSSADFSVGTWSPARGLLTRVETPTATFQGVRIGGAKRIAVLDAGTLRLVGLEKGDPLLVLEDGRGEPLEVERIALSGDGRRIAAVAKGLGLYDAATGERLWETAAKPFRFRVSHDASSVATFDFVKLRVLDGRTGACRFERALNRVQHLAFSRDGGRLAVNVHDGVLVLDARTGERVARVKAEGVSVCELSRSGRRLAFTTASRPGATLMTLGARRRRRLATSASVSAIAFSADEKMLACGRYDGTIALREVR